MAFTKILNHPNKRLILKLLIGEGRGVRYVSNKLKKMYPKDKTKQISAPTLQLFRKEHLKMEGETLQTLKKVKKEKRTAVDTKREHQRIQRMSSYRKKLHEAADMHVNIRKSLSQIDALLRERLENFFDMAQEGKGTREDEKLLQGYFDRYFVMIDKWAKYVDKLADQRIEQNINITVIDEQMSILRSAVVNVLQRFDSQLAITFMEELNKEMENLTYKHKKVESINKIHNEIELLSENTDVE